MELKLHQIGPIEEAQITFRDLTVLVGPQGTGKSIALQMLKLLLDVGHVQDVMIKYGLDWSGKVPEFLDAYFGEGMRSLWTEGRSSIFWKGEKLDLARLVGRRRRNTEESLFFIPAQRVLTLRDGWPRPFSDYSPGDPFVVRDFSEKLRTLVEKEFGGTDSLFPQQRRLKSEFREMLERTVFAKFRLDIDKVRAQRRLVLRAAGEPLPFMVWSAGQREFVPLLLGLYWLMPPGKTSRRGNIQWVALEELEMGLHPRAISVVMLMVLELVARGYRVCVTTHAPQVFEAVWALRHLMDTKAPGDALLAAFDAPKTQPMQKLARIVMKKKVSVYYFDAASGKVRDISTLDLESADSGEAAWGGLTEFSRRVNETVADAVSSGYTGGNL